jgi:DNA-binding YbaB/EbfC family protein
LKARQPLQKQTFPKQNQQQQTKPTMTNELMQAMMQMQEMQRRMEEVQATFDQILITEEAGGGMVRVTANGYSEVTKLMIDPSMLQASEKETLEDLIITAVNRATLAAREAATKRLNEVTDGFMPDIPGLGLGSRSEE